MKKNEKKKITRQDVVYRIALAGISAAVALLFVWLSVLVRFSTIAFYVAAGLALMVPLTQRYYSSALFAYVTSAALAFVIAGDVIVVAGYIVYFGPMALISGILCNVKLKQYFTLPIKIVYINGALAVMYFALGTIMIDSSLLGEIPYWAIAVIGTIALIVIDVVVQFIYLRMVPIMTKALRRNKSKDKPMADVDDEFDASKHGDPFDDDESPFSGSADRGVLFTYDNNSAEGSQSLDDGKENDRH